MEFICSVEQFMTPAARWSDLVLPSCTFLERNDFTLGEGVPFFGVQNQAIEPMGEPAPTWRSLSVSRRNSA